MRDLRNYRAKRDPARTPEPFGEDASARALPPGAARGFVVQQHAARALHYDLRLEIDGVLVSWAIPKGPSLDPAQKRLAVQTEDHPLEYGDFEGVIPTGNYGAGAMIVWDRGVYRSVDGHSPAEGLEAGKLDLALEGHKLRGRFALVRTRRGEGRDWLLFAKRRGAPDEKGRGDAEETELVVREPASVFSGLTVQELRDGRTLDAELEAAAHEAGAPRRRLDATKLRPMLATAEREPFRRAGWLFELKYDGVRVLAEKQGDGVRIFARTGADRTSQYAEVATALRHLPIEHAILDGEIVALDALGRSSFERIQRRFGPRDAASVAAAQREIPVLLYAFDLLAVGGHDLRRLPLVERKALLARLVPRLGFVRFADHVEEDGLALYEAARSHELEGVVAKRADSVYESGRRSKRWLKCKIPRTLRLVIAGALPGKGSRKRLGSLLLVGRDDGVWRYAGSVGSGLDAATLRELDAALDERAVDEAPFLGGPTPWPKGVRFAHPELVCEVRFTEVTSAGLLRHPVFVGLRPDADAGACEAPRPREALPEVVEPMPRPKASPGEPRLTHLDKIFWPVEGYTKGDLLAYYERIWPWIQPYLADRPVVLTRYPDGIEGKSFYQKNAPEFTPDWVTRETIDDTDYFVCNELPALLYVINSGAIPLHVWSARVGSIERPDWLILDLDPKDAPFSAVVTIARHIHKLLDAEETAHFVKTSGQAGIHVLLPLGGELTHDEARSLGEAVARTVVAELPEIATVTRPVAARGDKVYVDFLQNGRGKLIAAPFSVRPRPGAPISMPLRWTAVTQRLRPARYDIRSVFKYLEKHGDPFRGVLGPGIDAVRLLEGLARRLEGGSRSRRSCS